jgi:hypothetical protein
MRILVAYRGIPQSPGWATGDSLVRAFRRLGHEATPYGRFYSQLPEDKGDDPEASQARCGRPLGPVPRDVDLLVMLECNDADPQYLELAGLRCPKVYWEFDTEMHWPLTVGLLHHFNFNAVFFANPDAVLRVPNSVYLPYAADDDLFTAGDAVRSGAACLGSPFPERVEFCKQAGVELITGLYRERYVEALQKLAVHVHYHNSGGGSLLVMRVFETLACGALLVAPLCAHPHHLFSNMRECWNYCTCDDPDCRSWNPGTIIKEAKRVGESGEWWHGNPALPTWQEIAANGHRAVKSRHTYVHRAQRILQEVSS